MLGPAADVLEVAPKFFLGLLDGIEAGEGRDWEGVELELGGALPKKAKRDCWPLGGSFFCDDISVALQVRCTRVEAGCGGRQREGERERARLSAPRNLLDSTGHCGFEGVGSVQMSYCVAE